MDLFGIKKRQDRAEKEKEKRTSDYLEEKRIHKEYHNIVQQWLDDMDENARIDCIAYGFIQYYPEVKRQEHFPELINSEIYFNPKNDASYFEGAMQDWLENRFNSEYFNDVITSCEDFITSCINDLLNVDNKKITYEKFIFYAKEFELNDCVDFLNNLVQNNNNRKNNNKKSKNSNRITIVETDTINCIMQDEYPHIYSLIRSYLLLSIYKCAMNLTSTIAQENNNDFVKSLDTVKICSRMYDIVQLINNRDRIGLLEYNPALVAEIIKRFTDDNHPNYGNNLLNIMFGGNKLNNELLEYVFTTNKFDEKQHDNYIYRMVYEQQSQHGDDHTMFNNLYTLFYCAEYDKMCIDRTTKLL